MAIVIEDPGDSSSGASGAPAGPVYRPTPEYQQAVAQALLRVYGQCLICGHGSQPGEVYSIQAGCPYHPRGPRTP